MTLVYALDHPHDLPPDAVLRLVGGKAANLGLMSRDLGMPVPAGFVITTEACRAFLADGWPEGLDEEIRGAMSRVERAAGHGFGDPLDPLLVSVRSGAPVSMPGMMDTILDIGLTEATEPGLAGAGSGAAFARDCRERLSAQFRATVGVIPPSDPLRQLRLAVEAVFRSWDGARARAYRERESVPHDLGTAATVQAMVFGNRDERSGTGVLFTRNPATGERAPYGDVLFGAQGEDVVAGTHRTEPIAVLDERLPDVAHELRRHSDRLERHFADMCDIEFTVESGRLWMLQVRIGKRSPQAALRFAVAMADDPDFPLTREAAVRRVLSLLADPPVRTVMRSAPIAPLTVAIPASPGLASGEIATSPEDAIRVADDGRSVILVRSETSPDDVHGMARAAGILTSRGGIASHAAVVARGWGIPAVVGAERVSVSTAAITVDGVRLASGNAITIDGDTGAVYRGRVETTSEAVPAATTLLGWARELHIDVPAGRADARPLADADADAAESATRFDPSEVLRLVAVKGFATSDAVAEAASVSPDVARSALDTLVGQGLLVASAGAYRLSELGSARHGETLTDDRAALGPTVCAALLEGLLAFDARVKETVTAWQMREGALGDAAVVNDHADAAYDDRVLVRLAQLARESDAWLAEASRDVPRLDRYRARLAGAVAMATSGDHRYIASPRVDSFHGVWFELHEELILLAGRTRADEVAAGRA